jgi:hypothetical protein
MHTSLKFKHGSVNERNILLNRFSQVKLGTQIPRYRVVRILTSLANTGECFLYRQFVERKADCASFADVLLHFFTPFNPPEQALGSQSEEGGWDFYRCVYEGLPTEALKVILRDIYNVNS